MVVHPHSHGDSSCPAVLRIQLALLCFHLRGSHTLWRAFPCPLVNSADTCRCPYPVNIATYGLASSIFARHYSRNLVWFLFLPVLRCFSCRGSPRKPMCSVYVPWFFIMGVPTFGYLRINAYLQLPEAFRSLSRPSSAPNAKAFSICSSMLELPF